MRTGDRLLSYSIGTQQPAAMAGQATIGATRIAKEIDCMYRFEASAVPSCMTGAMGGCITRICSWLWRRRLGARAYVHWADGSSPRAGTAEAGARAIRVFKPVQGVRAYRVVRYRCTTICYHQEFCFYESTFHFAIHGPLRLAMPTLIGPPPLLLNLIRIWNHRAVESNA